MKTLLQRFIPLAALLGVVGLQADSSCCSTDQTCTTVKCYQTRSESRHKERQMVGVMDHTHKYDAESWYGTFSIMPGYSSSFRSEKIAKCLFGADLQDDDCCDGKTIKVQGSAVANRDSKAWLADYFYLPRNFDGSFQVEPRIKTFFLDFNFFVGLDEWCSGLYFRLHGPVVHTRWDLNFCESNKTDGAPRDHDEGYFTQTHYEGEKLVQSFGDYANGSIPTASAFERNNRVGAPASPSDLEVDSAAGTVVFQPLKYAKMSKCSRKETGFADLRFELGWNFLQCEDYHLGLNLQFAAPTGDKKEPCFLFDAKVGNGNHWELGGGLTGHYTFWTSEDGERRFGFHLDASVTHLFDKRHKRTFELRNKANSAYMLLSKFGPNPDTVPPNDQVVQNATGGTALVPVADTSNPNPDRQFALEYAPLANLSTINVDVSVGAQADIVALFNYTCGGFSWDLGYNLWARSCEKIDCPDKCNQGTICDSAQANTWALKGDSRMFGFQSVQVGTITSNDSTIFAVPLSATQCSSDIHSGTNKVAVANLVSPTNTANANAPGNDINLNVDGAAFAYLHVNGATSDAPLNMRIEAPDFGTGTAEGAPLAAANTQIKTSATPKFLSCNSLDLTRTRGISHSVFSHLNYTFDRECWVPYIGIGSSVEFGQTDDCCPSTSTSGDSCSSTTACHSCVDCAVSQWSVWVKGGLTFN